MDVAHRRDPGFLLWAVAGFLTVFGFVAMFSIGLPFMLAALVMLVWLSKRGPVWPEQLGLVAGAGVVCLVIALISAVSGDISPTLWAGAGTALVAAPTGIFWWQRCRSPAS